MNAFDDMIIFLSAIPKFADAKLVLKNNNNVSISRIVYSCYSEEILKLSFCSEDRGYLFLNDIDIEYFNILKKFIYQRNEFEKSGETAAYLILTSYIFGVSQMRKFVSSFFKKTDPLVVLNRIRDISTADKLSDEVVSKSYDFFAGSIDADMVNMNNIFKFDKESVQLLLQFLPKKDNGVRELFVKYEKDMDEMLEKLSIFRSKETIEKNPGSKLRLLKNYANDNCVAICGYKEWFIYIINWFFHCNDRNIDDFLVFLDCVKTYDEICSGLVQCILVGFRGTLMKLLTPGEGDTFVNSLTAIKKFVKSNECNCDYCKEYADSLDGDNDEVVEFIDENIDDFERNYDKEEVSLLVKSYKGKNILDDEEDELDGLESASVFCDSLHSGSTFGRESNIYENGSGVTAQDSPVAFADPLADDLSTLMDDESTHKEKLRNFSNCILIVGGDNTRNYLSDHDVYLYDIKNNRSDVVPDIYVGRKGCKVEYKDGNVFVFGGEDNNGNRDSSIITFNIRNKSIRNMRDSFSCGRVNHATIRQDNYVHIIGGELNDENETIVRYDLEHEKKVAYSFREPFEIFGHSLCEYQNAIYIYGGLTQIKSRNMFLFDHRSKRGLVKLKSPPIPILQTSVAWVDNAITSFGGKTVLKERSEPVVHKKILQYNPRSDDWSECELQCRHSFYAGGACYVDEKFYTFGGYNSSNKPQRSIYVFENGPWRKAASFPVPLADFDFIYLD
uniref:BTB domain-containing protein n=1 Tax=Strongyloides papillosus TaxID=174720 RepID=A0A0N5BA53_STREA